MKHLIPISGGKDSQATAIWYAQNKLHESIPVELIFCDTGNEAPTTYDFIFKVFVPALPPQMQNVITLKNKRGETLLQQAERKGRFPSKTRRFCTAELKVEPMIDYIISHQHDVVVFDGRRREESPERSKLNALDDFFGQYEESKPGEKLYRKRDVKKWIKTNTALVKRPVLYFSAKDVFEFIANAGFQHNELYDKGFNRVGCFPCILCSLGEITRVAEADPDKIALIREVEKRSGSTFFGPDKIPIRFCSNKILNDKGVWVGAPTIDEVINYAYSKRHDSGLFVNTCQNNYVSCE